MWWTKGWIVRGVALVAVAGGSLQLAPGPARTNPPVIASHTLQGATHVPAHVDALLRRACMDCHSNETRWPWYSRVAPLSWDVAADVARARKAMNLSEWAVRTQQRPAAAIGTLTAMCAGVQQDRMPLSKYRLLHPEARLTKGEKDDLCAWTTAEVAKHLEKKRRTLVTQNAH
jgi:Haem-binding domain